MTKDQSRDSGMGLVLLLLILYVVRHERVFLFTAIAFHVVNMIQPVIYRPLGVVWFGLSELLGTVMSRLLLSLVYLMVITPIGCIRRLVGKDALRLRAFKASTQSVMKKRDYMFSARDIDNPY